MQAVVLEDGNDVVQSDIPEKDLASKSVTRRRGETSFFVTSLSQDEEEGALLTLSLISVLISIWETAFQKLSFQKQSTLHHRRCS